MTPTKVVLLSCGSFNPVTNMHLRMFELARDALQRTGNFKVIAGIISPVSDKYDRKPLVCATHRCQMIERSLQTSDWITLDKWECEQNCWTETRNVLGHHFNRLNGEDNLNFSTPLKKRQKTLFDEANKNNESILLKLVCGADMLESFAVPNLWLPEHIEEIVGNFGLVCITRAGSNPYKFIYESDVLTKYQNNITIVTEWIQNDISSTKIRRALSRGESVKYLLPDTVIDYIKANGLYGTDSKENERKKDITSLIPIIQKMQT